MSSKKPANGRRSVPGSAGQKRPAPPSAPRSAARKKSKQAPQPTPVRPQPAMHSSSDDDSDDEEAIRRLKEAAAAKAAAAAHEDEDDEDDFEVAPGSDDEDEEQAGSGARAGPPSDLDDSEEEGMRDADESEEEEKPRPKKQAPTPAKKAAPPAAQPTPAKSSPSAKPTPAKSFPALKSTPAPAAAASAKKQALPSKKQASDSDSSSSSSDSETSDSETSDSEAEAPAAKPASAKPAPSASSSTASVPKTASKAKAKPSRVVLDDSSESSDDSDDDEPPPAFAKPQPPRKPTPLQGDASVNPPPKPAKVAAPASSSFDKPLSRPAPAPHTGRAFTVSIALPGSIIANAQSKELRTYVAGQIARAAATFNVDEIVVFAESGKQSHGGIRGNFEGATRSTDPDVFLARILQYLETPQYLRKQLFPKHADLVHAGLLNPLDSPHHVRADEEAPYREGVVLNRPVAPKQRGPQGACWANVGLKSEALVDRSIEPGTRLTVHIPDTAGSTSRKQLSGRAVAPSTPREKDGTYWGYTTRLAQNLSQVWSECPFKGGYDLSIGTSEHGEDCHSHSFGLPAFKHVILFFGGLAGLEEHIAADESLSVKQPQDMFQLYINSVIGQGCRTIRTEEAIPITLAALYRHIRTNQPPQ